MQPSKPAYEMGDVAGYMGFANMDAVDGRRIETKTTDAVARAWAQLKSVAA